MDIPFLLARDVINNGTNTTANAGRFDDCLNVTAQCPVEATIYGYYPSLAANAFFIAIFSICLLAQTALGLRYKTWTYLIALFFGCLGEVIGYAGRILLHNNPWDGTGFNMQICCLIIAPAFITAGVYLTLKHIVIEISPKHSYLRPRLYTWIFILCDLLSLILQGAGGGIAATANDNQSMQDIGNNLMMAGIGWQVFTLIVFGTLCTSYAIRVRAHRQSLSPQAHNLLSQARFKFFLGSIVAAYVFIFARCVYRIAEMAGGWKSAIMQDEASFIALEGAVIAVATVLLTVAHPGLVFPEMQQHDGKGGGKVARQEKDVEYASS